MEDRVRCWLNVELDGEVPECQSFSEWAEELKGQIGQLDLCRDVLKIHWFCHLQPCPAHRYIARLAREGLIEEIVTDENALDGDNQGDRGRPAREDVAIKKKRREELGERYKQYGPWHTSLEKVEKSEQLGAIRESWDRHEEWKKRNAALSSTQQQLNIFEERHKHVTRALEVVEQETALSGDFLQKYKEVLENTLRKFHISGFEGVEVSEEPRTHAFSVEEDSEENRNTTAIITTFEDGRGSSHFSTGQLGQVAIATMITQKQLANAFARHDFPNSVLLLDDVSSSYDLTNLTREALLWRQIAYDKSAGTPHMQIFISSHHDSMNNHLLSLLAPPAGCSMNVLIFNDWSLENGPEISTYRVDESSEISTSVKEFCNDLNQATERALCARA
jgi:hypothetical protein